MNYKNKLIIILTLICFSPLTQAYVTKDFSSQRRLFLEVEADLKKGSLTAYRKHKQALSNYPLFPYLKYELLRSNLDTTPHSEISAFTKTYHNSPLAEKIRKEWLAAKAKKNQWRDFILAYNPEQSTDIALQCQFVQASLEYKKDKDVYKYVPNIWLTATSQPKECDRVFANWRAAGGLTRNLLWQRIKLAAESGNDKLARYLAKDLNKGEQQIVELWIRTHNDPKIITKPHYFTSKHSAISEILVHGMKIIAKRDPQDAVRLWKTLEKQHKFNEHHWSAIVKEIGISLSHRLDFNANKWLCSLPKKLQDNDVNNARLKVAIHANAWDTIIDIYNDLAVIDQKNDKYQYWYARALEMVGDRELSQDILINLAQIRNYYGFLASSRILRPYAFNHVSCKVCEESINAVLTHPAVARAQELRELGRIYTAKSEWNRAILTMDDQHRITAAHLASRWELPNWAIVALANSSNKNDLDLRFPKTYSDFIHQAAKNNNLDAELLFAITRQESAFIPTAKSPAGALGLMQIMPNTGKMVAKQNKEQLNHQNELLHPEKNIRLGSKYVRMMLDQYQQNPALATASYNAGPNRVARWLPEFDTPADSWIETIPFKETREYVQNVLTYTVIYQQLLGKTPRMNKYMPIINGRRRSQG